MFTQYTQDSWFRAKGPSEQAGIVVLNATMAFSRGDIDVTTYHAAMDWAMALDPVAAEDAVVAIAIRSRHIGGCSELGGEYRQQGA